MKLVTQTISEKLSPALKAHRPARTDVEQFGRDLEFYLGHIDSKETEENLKTHFMGLLKPTYQPSHTIEQYGDIDFVIRTGGKGSPAAVLFEAKRELNKADMIRQDDINRKALHELILYFFRERHAGNTDIRHVVICTEFEMYVFQASDFERTFYQNKVLRKDFQDWAAGKKSDSTTDFFYKEIAAKFIAANEAELKAVHIDLRSYKTKLKNGADDKAFVKLFKLLSPHGLIAKELSNDSNSLNKAFYDELLHLIGLEERKEGAKRVIGRLEASKRNPGSLLENAISQIRYQDDFNDPTMIQTYGSSNDEREFNIALELCLTWVNRLLFLKLLEAQIFKFHGQDPSYKFLSTSMVADFDDLSDLFFKVLAFAPSERDPHITAKYEKVPYLNSSLFERTKLEKSFRISDLTNGLDAPLFSRTVLRDATGRRASGRKGTLAYIFDFLDAYDFGTVGNGVVQEESKTIINAAVLGLIFEKINGYKEGAIFTPGFVTMYMARKVIEKTVLEAFQKENPSWTLTDTEDLRNNISDDRSKSATLRHNAVIDNLKICDPAVGSGHFLVSCLNELIALKSRLGILADAEGNRLSDYVVEVDNDELIVVNADTDEVFAYQVHGTKVPKRLQQVQQTLFHEKQKLIENCLFGVDINSNSVRICQLRLWIELLKSAYYRDGQDSQLETLPNIDINIKCGNSLLSRFTLDQNLSEAFKKAKLTVSEYRKLVRDYKRSKSKDVKRQLQAKIDSVKTQFHEEELGRITKQIDAEIAGLRAKEAQDDLFLDEEQNKKIEAKLKVTRERIQRLEGDREKLLQRKTFLGALEWRFEFPEVLDDKGKYIGFDVVIANPPYGVSIQEPMRTHIISALGKVPDYEIYYLFINLASRIAKLEGHTCQIIPNTILFNFFAKSYREQLLHDWKDLHIDDLTGFTVFDGIVVHNVIIHGRRRVGSEGVNFRRTGQSKDVSSYLLQPIENAPVNVLSENIGNWGLVFRLDAKVMSAVSKIRNVGQQLKDRFPLISQGLIAYDKYRGQSEEVIKNRVYHSENATSTNSPWLKGEDVTRFSVKWNQREYVEYSSKLANPRQPEFFQKPRILVREITNPRVFAAYTQEELYNDPALINILVENDQEFDRHVLLAILNSKVASFFHFNSSPKATKGAFPKILVNDLKTFPLPELAGNEDLVSKISTRTMQLIAMASNGDLSEKFKELDDENERDVFSLYGLSGAEIEMVEQYFDRLGKIVGK
ncbi:TaqI-like C-terminal specificity domain-containing protein [Celeribacter sp.]|uniref:type IIG restriction enzyme/methyltransferase n=1 Tax=Celeribacter sp. TaxID=1890673 RepID=UPI003A92AEC6